MGNILIAPEAVLVQQGMWREITGEEVPGEVKSRIDEILKEKL